MYKIYTPKAWYSTFGGCPTIVIDDDGMIYRDEDYHKSLRTAIGKVDYSTGYIYGEDYHRVSRQPIGAIKQEGDLTKIYGEDYYRLNAWPILYIRDNRIYSDDEFYKTFPAEAGYIREGASGRASATSSSYSTGSASGSSYGGGAGNSGGSGDSRGSEEREGGIFKTVVICLAVLVISVLLVKFIFFDDFGSAESNMAWISVSCGAALALIFSKRPGQSIKIVGFTSGILTWVCDLAFTYMEKGKIAGQDFFMEVILAPFILFLVYIIPAVIVGCLVSLIKGHFKGMLKELKEYKAQKGKKQ